MMEIASAIESLRSNGIEVETDASRVAAGMRDWWPVALRDRQPAPGSIIVRPATIAATALAIRQLSLTDLQILPMGGRSNVVGALGPRRETAAVDLLGLNRIEAVNQIDATVRTEAGVYGGRLESTVRAAGYTLGHYPQSLEISTVGGWVSTRATGTFSTRYGGIERLLVGLEVVLPDGTLIVQPNRPRQPAGPAVMDLFVGAEGRLGVVVACRLRVQPQPERRILRSFEIPDLGVALKILRELIQQGAGPAALRLYDPVETSALGQAWGLRLRESLLIVAFDGLAEIAEATARVASTRLASSGAVDIGSEAAERWYEGRFRYRWLVEGNGLQQREGELVPVQPGLIADAIEVSAPWSRLQAVIQAGRLALAQTADEVWYHVSHGYPDGASVYFILFIRQGSDAEARGAYHRCWSATMAAVLAAGGGFAHHHGIGQARAAWRIAENGGTEQMLGAVELALDPAGRFRPRI